MSKVTHEPGRDFHAGFRKKLKRHWTLCGLSRQQVIGLNDTPGIAPRQLITDNGYPPINCPVCLLLLLENDNEAEDT